MLRSLRDLERYTVSAVDGDIGNVVDFLVEDEHWSIRYLIVDTGGGFLEVNGRQVLVSPRSFRRADWSTYRFHLALTLDKVKNSPSIDLDKPVSRQQERDQVRYFGYDKPAGNAHLRSANELRGYHIQGTDAAIGHVEDFVVDDETWDIRYLVVDTRDWWFGRKVLVAPHWASDVDWLERKVHLTMSRQEVKGSPEWSTASPINREYEERLYDYHGRPVYWRDDLLESAAPRPEQGANHPA